MDEKAFTQVTILVDDLNTNLSVQEKIVPNAKLNLGALVASFLCVNRFIDNVVVYTDQSIDNYVDSFRYVFQEWDDLNSKWEIAQVIEIDALWFGARHGDVNHQIASDAAKLISRQGLQELVLVTGNGYFVDPVRRLKKSVYVTVVACEEKVSHRLKREADRFVPITLNLLDTNFETETDRERAIELLNRRHKCGYYDLSCEIGLEYFYGDVVYFLEQVIPVESLYNVNQNRRKRQEDPFLWVHSKLPFVNPTTTKLFLSGGIGNVPNPSLPRRAPTGTSPTLEDRTPPTLEDAIRMYLSDGAKTKRLSRATRTRALIDDDLKRWQLYRSWIVSSCNKKSHYNQVSPARTHSCRGLPPNELAAWLIAQ